MLALRRALLVALLSLPLFVVLSGTDVSTAATTRVQLSASVRSATVDRSIVLPIPAGAGHLAIYWRGAPGAAVAYSLSRDGASFGPMQDAGRDETGEARRNGTTYSALHLVDGAMNIRITADRRLPDVQLLTVTDAARTTTTSASPRAATAAPAQPAVLPRSDWGADESLRFTNGQETWPPTFFPTKKLVVHHTDTQNADPDPASTVRAIYYYHSVTQGWGDIGYNFLIDEAGRIYEGRHSRDYPVGTSPSGDDSAGRGVTGAHAQGWNSGTVGIALLGTLDTQQPTPAARAALVKLLAWEAGRNGIDPHATSTFVNPVSGATITTPDITGHRDYVATACPGATFNGTLPSIRTDVAALLAPPDTTAPSRPTTLVATAGTRAVITTWAASTDNVRVTGYRVQRATASAGPYATITTTSQLRFTDSGRVKGKRYWYRVAALDAAGNRSAFAGPVSAVAR